MCSYTFLHIPVPWFFYILQCISVIIKNRKVTDLWNIKPVGLRKHSFGMPIILTSWRNSEKQVGWECFTEKCAYLWIQRSLSALGCFTARLAVHLNCRAFWWNWPPSFFLKMTLYDVFLLKCLSTYWDSKSVGASCFFSLSTKCIHCL